jgi:hypothetical protein
MTDFADLGIRVDTSDLKRAQTDLRGLSATGADTERRLTGSASRIVDGWRSMAINVAKSLGVMAAAALSIGGISRAAAGIDSLAKSARRLDMTVTSFQALRLVASEAGASVESLANDLQVMAREIERGGDRVSEAAVTLGISLADLKAADTTTRLEMVADRIKALGLNAGQASIVLQDFGIRNREMVLMLMQGGDAMRNARRDIDDYGLALSSTTVEAVERANDQIGRLGLVMSGFGQAIAAAVIPVLGKLAHAFTESMREGGTLRTVVDNLVPSMQALGVVVVALAATQIPAMASGIVTLIRGMSAASVASGVLTTALGVLRGAVALAGGPWGILAALVAGVASYVVLFRDTTETVAPIVKEADSAIASLNEALAATTGALPETARQTLGLTNENIKLARSAYVAAEAQLALAKANLSAAQFQLDTEAMSGLPQESLPGNAAVQSAIDALSSAEAKLAAAQRTLNERVNEGQLKLSELADAAATANREISIGVNLSSDFADALGGGGGRSGGGVAAAAEDATLALQGMTPVLDTLKSHVESMKDAFRSAFVGIVTGAKTAKQAIGELLNSLATMLANKAFEALWGGLTGGLFSGGGLPILQTGPGTFIGGSPPTTISSFASGTAFAPGGLALVGERGPELVNLPRGSKVYPADQTERMLRGGEVAVRVYVDQGGNWQAAVEQVAGSVVARVAPQIVGRSVQAVGRLNRESRAFAMGRV